jgi:hypothetical protein
MRGKGLDQVKKYAKKIGEKFFENPRGVIEILAFDRYL